MSAQSHFFCKSFDLIPPPSPVRRSPTSPLHLASSSSTFSPRSSRFSFPSFSASPVTFSRSHISVAMVSNSKRPDTSEDNSLVLSDAELDRFAAVGNALADASGEVIRKYFRKKFDIVDKDDMRRKTGDRRVLDWASRYRIVVGAAREIAYLHHDCIPHIIHRDIKSSNILLDHNMEARVCDIGLATLYNDKSRE